MSTIHAVTNTVCALARLALATLLPPVCCLCGAAGQRPDFDLCEVCEQELPFLSECDPDRHGPGGDDDSRRDGSDPGGQSLDSSTRDSPGETTPVLPVSACAASAGAPVPPAADGGDCERRSRERGLAPASSYRPRIRALFDYTHPVDFFIRSLKFRGERVYARVLGMLLARACRERGWALPAAIVPMPLHRARYRRRGFNQAREIARYAAAELGVPVLADALIRVRPTREQSALPPAERRRNVRGAFRVVRPLPQGRIALLDDVVTTGSTALAAAHALAAAESGEIEVWAAARVLRTRDGHVMRRRTRAGCR